MSTTVLNQPTSISNTTALDVHKHLNTQSQKTEDILKKVKDSGVDYIYYQVVALSGRVVAKAVPAKQLMRNLEKGIQFHRTAMSDLQATRAGVLLGGGVQASELIALPDIDTFNVLPWDKQMGSFFCTAYEPEHVPEIGGQILGTDARANLRHVHQQFKNKHGLTLKTGCEPEMSWIGDDIKVHVRPGASPAYHMGSFEIMRPIYKKVMEYASAMGLDMIEGDYEDPTQLELNWMFDDCELTADRLITYRLICRQVAREHGVIASFMPKPYTSSMGNGCHHNFSLWDAHGDNVLMEKGRRELHLTDVGHHALGGVLNHASGAMMVMASTVNSYKRFWDTGLFAPSIVNWGMDNKSCTVRLSANGRLEYKTPDSSVNPYLSHALMLAAMDDGIVHKMDPGMPSSRDSYAESGRVLPLTLGDAIKEFENDSVMFGALPAEMANLYRDLKADEWARACSAVTDWEYNMYLEYLP
ncbi:MULTISPECIES: glutamine synthetase family protein [Vitreoscilla]|uniref:Glutamine synthetase n=1 Tax=Vitreoscilla stercoraria TaxID=61 RepID=A0ABY4EB05_VITST|nr:MULTISPECIES: hypothetical protein [Vitreoscilla]AUZ05657.2 glutamine synthetase [Vitreoscilla sp. C1]UOO92934.1 glutamine synthetase [Vitreoscilla stercoraria]